jgi:hypothetical protein
MDTEADEGRVDRCEDWTHHFSGDNYGLGTVVVE